MKIKMKSDKIREIMYRAYVKDIKKVCHVLSIDFLNEKVKVLIDEDRGKQEDYLISKIILMQYTNRKDKNHELIFEGDIVISEHDTKFTIVWSSTKRTYYGVGDKGDKYGPYTLLLSEGAKYDEDEFKNHIEVIGNIYEGIE